MAAWFQDVPAPWHLRGDVYWILLGAQKTLPKGAYHPLEQPDTSDPHVATNKYLGGLGTVWVVRYTESPVGPYDELIYHPGDFTAPSGARRARVTAVYVSSPASVYNARKNWNTPKHLAHFVFTPLSDGATHISVSPPDAPDTPFFTATVAPSSFPFSIPFDASWVPTYFPLVQPPLRQGKTDEGEVASEEWQSMMFGLTGRIRPVWWSNVTGDGWAFPALDNIWSLGVHWSPAEVVFHPAEKVDCEPPSTAAP